MKHLTLFAAAIALAGVSSCRSAQENNHWHPDNVGTRISYHLSGDLFANDKVYSEEARREASDVGLLLRRHLMNDDPENPLLPSSQPPPSPPKLPEGEFTTSP